MVPKVAGDRIIPPRYETQIGYSGRRTPLRVAISIEDPEELAKIAGYMESRGYDVIRVPIAIQLVNILDFFHPGLVFLDRVDILEDIREHVQFFDVPTVFFTEWTDDNLVKGYRAGADICLPLPCDFENFYGLSQF